MQTVIDKSDGQLVREYVESGSQNAFAEIRAPMTFRGWAFRARKRCCRFDEPTNRSISREVKRAQLKVTRTVPVIFNSPWLLQRGSNDAESQTPSED